MVVEQQSLISGKQLELLRRAVEIEDIDAQVAGMVGYSARLWAQVSLPYRDPGDAPKWVRVNGSLELVVRPGRIVSKTARGMTPTRSELSPACC